MKVNLPVSGREFDYDASQMLVSMTDLKGRIVHCNDAFVAVSGYTREELIGKAHNIVRHPDMPPAAYADLWVTLQAGLSWTAMIKNRRKNGDHYWIRANTTPIVSNGSVTGYLSVRVKPQRAEVEAAETLYRSLREGRAHGVRIERGRVCHDGLRGAWERVAAIGLVTRFVIAFTACALLPVSAVALGAGTWLTLSILLLACVAGASWLVATVARPLQTVSSAVQRLAAADLSVHLASTREDEIGELFRGLTQTAVNLTAVVQDVMQGAAVLETVAAEISSGNADLSQRTEQQAANLEQTAASMEQINSTVKSNADTARQASQLASSASAAAFKGGDVVGQVVSTMEKITASSKKIGDIIGVIDSIAFQTNILALNAAVEAARAGEQGRGFAVVASEVRSLAQRSAEAAKEIKALIGTSVEEVGTGSNLVRIAGDSMNDIVKQVKRVAQLIDEISSTAIEQTTGIGQVNDAVNQLEQVTQQNAALVEEATAATDSLSKQASRLVEAVSVFSLDYSEGAQATNADSLVK